MAVVKQPVDQALQVAEFLGPKRSVLHSASLGAPRRHARRFVIHCDDLIYHGFIPLWRWRSILRRTATYRFAKGRTHADDLPEDGNHRTRCRHRALKAEVAEVKAKGLALDMARGKPSPSQVDISRPMLDILNADADLHDGNVDCSNYGCFEGIPSARKLAGEFLGCPAEQTLVLARRVC